MKRLTQWLDSQHPPAGFVRKCFDGPPFGNCYITIDPDRQARFASGNMNCVYLCGAEPGMNSESTPLISSICSPLRGSSDFSSGSARAPEWRLCAAGLAETDLRACNGPVIRRYVAVSVGPFRSAPTWRCTKSAPMKSPQCANLRIRPSGPTMCGRSAAKASSITWRSTASVRWRLQRCAFSKTSAT